MLLGTAPLKGRVAAACGACDFFTLANGQFQYERVSNSRALTLPLPFPQVHQVRVGLFQRGAKEDRRNGHGLPPATAKNSKREDVLACLPVWGSLTPLLVPLGGACADHCLMTRGEDFGNGSGDGAGQEAVFVLHAGGDRI